MLMNSRLPFVLQTSLLALLFQPIICPSSETITRNRRSQSSRTHTLDKSESLLEETVNLCGFFVCLNTTGLILFNNTIKHPPMLDLTAPEVPSNISKNTKQIQIQSGKAIGDNVCLDDEGQVKQKVYCKTVANYPTHSILESMIKRQKLYNNFEKLLNQDLDIPEEIAQRSAHDQQESEHLLCETVPSIIYPKSGATKKNKWMLIVNDEDNYKQGVKIEECLHEGTPCSFVDKPSDYKVICKQSYRYPTLWAIKDNITIVQEQFQIPCCCQCVSRINYSYVNG